MCLILSDHQHRVTTLALIKSQPIGISSEIFTRNSTTAAITSSTAQHTATSAMSLPQKQVRLPHLSKLRVKSALPRKTGGPCNVALTNLLSCWASNGQGEKVCNALEMELKNCMATRVSINPRVKVFVKVVLTHIVLEQSKSSQVVNQLPCCPTKGQGQPSSSRLVVFCLSCLILSFVNIALFCVNSLIKKSHKTSLSTTETKVVHYSKPPAQIRISDPMLIQPSLLR